MNATMTIHGTCDQCLHHNGNHATGCPNAEPSIEERWLESLAYLHGELQRLAGGVDLAPDMQTRKWLLDALASFPRHLADSPVASCTPRPAADETEVFTF